MWRAFVVPILHFWCQAQHQWLFESSICELSEVFYIMTVQYGISFEPSNKQWSSLRYRSMSSCLCGVDESSPYVSKCSTYYLQKVSGSQSHRYYSTYYNKKPASGPFRVVSGDKSKTLREDAWGSCNDPDECPIFLAQYKDFECFVFIPPAFLQIFPCFW